MQTYIMMQLFINGFHGFVIIYYYGYPIFWFVVRIEVGTNRSGIANGVVGLDYPKFSFIKNF